METRYIVLVRLDNRDERVIKNVQIQFTVVAENAEQAETYTNNYLAEVLQIKPLEIDIKPID